MQVRLHVSAALHAKPSHCFCSSVTSLWHEDFLYLLFWQWGAEQLMPDFMVPLLLSALYGAAHDFFSPLRSHMLEALQWPLLHRATNSLPLWEQRKDDGLFCQLWIQLQAAVALTMAGPTLALCRYINCFCFLTTWGKKLLSEWSQMHRVMLKDLQPLCKELQPETLEEAHKTFVEFIPGN